MSFTFTDLFVELKKEVGQRLDPPSLFMMSLASKSLHALFKQTDLKAERVSLRVAPTKLDPMDLIAFQDTPFSTQTLGPRVMSKHFLNIFQSHRTILSTRQRILLECVIAKDYRSIFEFLLGPCDWVLNMAALTELALTLVRQVLISTKHVHGYVQFKAHPTHLAVSCGPVDSIIPAEDFAMAIGESGSMELIAYVNKHYELILPVLGKEHHPNFLEGLLVHDNVEMFRQSIPLPAFGTGAMEKEWNRFHGAFARHGAFQCLDLLLDHFIEVGDTPESYHTTSVHHIICASMVLINHRKSLESSDYILFDVLAARCPEFFTIYAMDERRFGCDHTIPLVNHILKNHPSPMGRLTDLELFKSWLTETGPLHFLRFRYRSLWFSALSAFFPEEFRAYIEKEILTRAPKED